MSPLSSTMARDNTFYVPAVLLDQLALFHCLDTADINPLHLHPRSPPTMSTPTPQPRYKLTFTTPHPSLPSIKSALFAAGAGTYPGGKYTHVCFETPGTSQFMPNEGAVPNIGTVGVLERVQEMRVEVLCVGPEVMRRSVEALKR